MKQLLFLITLFGLGIAPLLSQNQSVIPGAYQTEEYLGQLKGKRIGMVVNHTSMVREYHLVDYLLARNIQIERIFAPEHGFRGEASAGEYVKGGTDKQTGLDVVSLYGRNKKPTAKQLKDIDLVVFDIQDVGVRFYTYISTLTYVMEACAEQDIPVLVLDRPNPNIHYIDGPILEPEFTSFIGLHPVPIVYGLTIGEYGLMVNGEKWLNYELQCDYSVIPVKNYTRSTPYSLPIPPSPNLPNQRSILLYPSLCLLEGTPFNCGRGTNTQFQVFGDPEFDNSFVTNDTVYVPVPMDGAKSPKNKYKENFGRSLTYLTEEQIIQEGQINLSYLMQAYQYYPKDEEFFKSFFYKLCGTKKLSDAILSGTSEEDIRADWKPGLEQFNEMRKKYFIYPVGD